MTVPKLSSDRTEEKRIRRTERSAFPPLFQIIEKEKTMKKRDAKLSLHRETLRQLDAGALTRANGGVAWTGCDSACTECGGPIRQFTVVQPADSYAL